MVLLLLQLLHLTLQSRLRQSSFLVLQSYVEQLGISFRDFGFLRPSPGLVMLGHVLHPRSVDALQGGDCVIISPSSPQSRGLQGPA